MADPIRIAGITWYTRENYAACREIMADKNVLPTSYDAWCQKAEGQIREWEGRGFRIVKAYIDAEQFKAWCAARQLDVDAKARVTFANDFAARQVRN